MDHIGKALPSSNGYGREDRFVGAEVDLGGAADLKFDAGQYSFFGEAGDDGGLEDDSLGGALEDDMDAPPMEDLGGLEDGSDGYGNDLMTPDEGEDLSLATMLRNQVRLNDAQSRLHEDRSFDDLMRRAMPANSSQDDSLLAQSPPPQPQQQQQQSPMDALSSPFFQHMHGNVLPAASTATTPSVKLHAAQAPPGFEQQQQPPLPPQPMFLHSMSGSFSSPQPPPASGGWLGQLQNQVQQQVPGHQHMPAKISGPMTAEQLEAQMLGRVQSAPAASTVPPPLALPSPPPPQQPAWQGHAQPGAPQPPPLPGSMHGGGYALQSPMHVQSSLGPGQGPMGSPALGPLRPQGSPFMPHHNHPAMMHHRGIPPPPPGFAGAMHGPPRPGMYSPPPPPMPPPGMPLHPHQLQHQQHLQQQRMLLMQQQQQQQADPRMLSPRPHPHGMHVLMPPPYCPSPVHGMHAMAAAGGSSLGPFLGSPFPPPHGPASPARQHSPLTMPMGYRPPPPARPGDFDNGYQAQRHLQFSPQRSRPGAKRMSADEIDHIMNIMYAAVHSGYAYVEDYYYQAFVNRYFPGKNTASFQPEILRDLTDEVTRLDPCANVRFVQVEGLGKIVLTNIRTPKVLMDLSIPSSSASLQAAGGKVPEQPTAAAVATNSDASATASAAAAAPAKLLEQEPLLAARIMIEDCINLLLDVDDIDRMFAAAAARSGNSSTGSSLPQDAEQLRQRRALLLAGVAASFRLPAAAVAAADGGTAAVGDGVFLQIMGLPKGRSLLARTLRLMAAPGSAAISLPKATACSRDNDERSNSSAIAASKQANPLHMLWAGLRHAPQLFGTSLYSLEPSSLQLMVEATAKLAAAMKEAVSKLRTVKQVVECLMAVVLGCQQLVATDIVILPLANTRPTQNMLSKGDNQQQPWLADVIAALLSRALQLGLPAHGASNGSRSFEANNPHDEDLTPELCATWQANFESLYGLLLKHLEALQPVHAAAAAANNPQALQTVRALIAKQMVQAMAHHATDAQRSQLRDHMLRLLAL